MAVVAERGVTVSNGRAEASSNGKDLSPAKNGRVSRPRTLPGPLREFRPTDINDANSVNGADHNGSFSINGFSNLMEVRTLDDSARPEVKLLSTLVKIGGNALRVAEMFASAGGKIEKPTHGGRDGGVGVVTYPDRSKLLMLGGGILGAKIILTTGEEDNTQMTTVDNPAVIQREDQDNGTFYIISRPITERSPKGEVLSDKKITVVQIGGGRVHIHKVAIDTPDPAWRYTVGIAKSLGTEERVVSSLTAGEKRGKPADFSVLSNNVIAAIDGKLDGARKGVETVFDIGRIPVHETALDIKQGRQVLARVEEHARTALELREQAIRVRTSTREKVAALGEGEALRDPRRFEEILMVTRRTLDASNTADIARKLASRAGNKNRRIRKKVERVEVEESLREKTEMEALQAGQAAIDAAEMADWARRVSKQYRRRLEYLVGQTLRNPTDYEGVLDIVENAQRVEGHTSKAELVVFATEQARRDIEAGLERAEQAGSQIITGEVSTASVGGFPIPRSEE